MPSAKLQPNNHQRHAELLQRGMALQGRGKGKEAEYCYQLVLRDDPKHPDALNLLATLAVEAGKFTAAIELFQKVVKVAPKNLIYRNNLANCYIRSSRPDEALPQLRRVLAGNPKMSEALYNLARAYRAMGKGEEAVQTYQRMLAFEPGSLPARIGLGEVLTDLGRMDEATGVFRAVIADAPESVEAFTGLVAAHKFTADDRDIDAVLALLDRGFGDLSQQTALHHAAGKIYNDLKQYDEAFVHFAKAKEIAGRQFSIADYRRFIDKTCQLFTVPFFLERTHHGNRSERPVFIVGMPRSGTTLTEQILASHSKIKGAGELVDLQRIERRITETKRETDAYFSTIAGLSADQSRGHADVYLNTLKRHSRVAERVVDKMPHNFELLGLIALLFPNARIVHCRRNPIDTCISCFTHNFTDAHGYNADFSNLGLYYREYARLMAHWAKVLPSQIFDLQYEQMVADQEATTRRLIDFLGLDWEDACTSFHLTERAVSTPSRWQVRQPIYNSSVQRWRRFEPHLGPLKKSLGDLFVTE
ncbi:tetratricopeptide repeat-containing sulfotransferase family protein [Anderseniella sp. Alg231-50]|uniref:tetratricopeptide repeat-containing sulfotransferase family protein n=1 Tax=Anderseniella sp. Alg231-50 TaxID=1922226 RepID=UPI00307B9DA7